MDIPTSTGSSFLLQLAQSLLSQVVQRTLTAGPLRVFAVADYGSSVGNNSVVELANVLQHKR